MCGSQVCGECLSLKKFSILLLFIDYPYDQDLGPNVSPDSNLLRIAVPCASKVVWVMVVPHQDGNEPPFSPEYEKTKKMKIVLTARPASSAADVT